MGIKYLMLMETALYYRAFFSTKIFAPWRLACTDPIEAVLSAADRHGVKFFIGGGFYGDWKSPHIIADPVAARKRLQAIEELTRLYSHHPSFDGWNWPNEASIDRYYSDEFIRYVNTRSRLARRLTPRAKILIAPYGTRVAVADDKNLRQLESLDVDFIAYQDEVGVWKSTPEETPRFYEGLRKVHDPVHRSATWARIWDFRISGSRLQECAASSTFLHVLRQFETVSTWVKRFWSTNIRG